eukprot:Skav208611  [mRNA]  locus=scaffold2802:46445:47612:- [translate_table: standard]
MVDVDMSLGETVAEQGSCSMCRGFSSLNPTNIECIVGWCNAFRALEVLKTLLTSEAIAVSESEIEVLFKYIDADGSGDLSLSELVLGGHLTKSQAEELFQKCRRKNDAAISDKEQRLDLRNYIKGLSMAPGKDMKGVLEVFAHSPKAHTPEPEPMLLAEVPDKDAEGVDESASGGT